MMRMSHVTVAALLGAAATNAGANDKVKVVATTQAQEKLAHFVSDDGNYGFILDRSTSTPKLKLDGDPAIIELTVEEDRDHGELSGYLYRSPEGKRRIYISVRGSIKLFRGNDEHWVTFDKNVPALGAPTVKGKYVPETPAYQKLAAELTKHAVRTKQPAMTSLDASNLAKVTDAFKAASADMFVRYHAPSDGWGATYIVASVSGGGYGRNDYMTDETETKRHKALARVGGMIHGFSSPDAPLASHIIVDRAGDAPKLADGTPGLIWEVDGVTAIFVSLDGARYSVSLNTSDKKPVFVVGAGPDASWPKTVADAYLDYGMVSSLVKAGALAKENEASLQKIDATWTDCTAKGWTALVKKARNNPRMTEGQADAGIAKLHKACNKSLDNYEKALVKIIDARVKERAAVLSAATASAKTAK